MPHALLEREVTRAVLLNAGVGTRTQPASRDEGKALFPAGRFGKVIDYAARDIQAAGITHVTIVEGSNGEPVRNHFKPRTDGQIEYVLATGKRPGTYERMLAIDQGYGLTFNYVKQPVIPYGTGAAKAVVPSEGEYQLFTNADDLVLDQNGNGLMARFVQNWKASGADHAIMAQMVDESVASNYGILEVAGNRLIGIEEQPKRPKTNIANVGRYIFSPAFDAIMDAYMAGPPAANGEYQLTAAIPMALAAGQSIYVEIMQPTDMFLDFGSMAALGASITRLAIAEKNIQD